MKRLNRNLILTLCLFVMAASSCQRSKNLFTLEGNLKNVTGNELYLFGTQQPFDRIDTIRLDQNGTFKYEMETDTLYPLTLLFNQEHTLPLFIDKGITVTIKGDALQPNSIRISGGEANEELNLFKEQTRHLTDSAAYIAQADSFIRRHPFSQVSVYLFDTYFVQTSHPDYQRMNELINSMSGILHDHPLIQSIQTKPDNAIKSDTGRYISSFRIKNLKGEYLTSYRFRDKVMVVSFWATWNEPSLKLQKELKALRGKLKKEDIAFVNVALDMDLKRWKEAIANDTIDTEHACDGEGWEGTTARLFGIEKLPMTVVINPQRKVVVRSADIQELTGHIEATLKKEKERKSKIKKR